MIVSKVFKCRYKDNKKLQNYIFKKYKISWRNHTPLTYFNINSLVWLKIHNIQYNDDDWLFLEIIKTKNNKEYIVFCDDYDVIDKNNKNIINYSKINRKNKLKKILNEQ